jgi:hypothetical protein
VYRIDGARNYRRRPTGTPSQPTPDSREKQQPFGAGSIAATGVGQIRKLSAAAHGVLWLRQNRRT